MRSIGTIGRLQGSQACWPTGPGDIEDLGPDRDALTWGTRGRGLLGARLCALRLSGGGLMAPPANAPLPPPPKATLLSFAGARW